MMMIRQRLYTIDVSGNCRTTDWMLWL